MAPHADFALARALRTRDGVPLGEVFRFISALYFRGKLAYAQRYARPGSPSWWGSGVLVITANRGLVPAETRVCLEHLEAFAQTDIDAKEPDYRGPVARDATQLGRELGNGHAVLLGSVATPKYVDVLVESLGDRVLYPRALLGLGDMARGSLLLRAAAGVELPYEALRDAPRKPSRRG